MDNITPELAEIIGLLCAEGCHVVSYSSYWGNDRGRKRFYKNDKSERIEFYNKDKNLLLHYQDLVSKEFSYNPKITKHGKINICKMAVIKQITSSTELGNLIWRVPKSVTNSSNEVKIVFIRGFFDGDGTSSNRVRMFSTNIEGLKKISDLLNDLNVKHTMQKPILKENRKPLYTLQISEKEKESFLNTIKPVSKLPGYAGVAAKL